LTLGKREEAMVHPGPPLNPPLIIIIIERVTARPLRTCDCWPNGPVEFTVYVIS